MCRHGNADVSYTELNDLRDDLDWSATTKYMNELTIRIYQAEDEDGFYYDIYDTAEPIGGDIPASIDGGFCTTTIENALEMAVKQSLDLINQSK